MISYGVSIDADLLSIINKTNYREIATVIALSVMTEGSSSRKGGEPNKEKEQQQNREVAEL
jgi:hypothetical protein